MLDNFAEAETASAGSGTSSSCSAATVAMPCSCVQHCMTMAITCPLHKINDWHNHVVVAIYMSSAKRCPQASECQRQSLQPSAAQCWRWSAPHPNLPKTMCDVDWVMTVDNTTSNMYTWQLTHMLTADYTCFNHGSQNCSSLTKDSWLYECQLTMF